MLLLKGSQVALFAAFGTTNVPIFTSAPWLKSAFIAQLMQSFAFTVNYFCDYTNLTKKYLNN